MSATVTYQGYQDGAYLSGPYLEGINGLLVGMQVAQKVEDVTATYGMQSTMYLAVADQKLIGMQSTMEIDADLALGMQAIMLRVERLGMQATLVLYNITQLRVMCAFPSRGIPALLGQNWTSNSQAAGDFHAYNVNTDIPEQVFRSIVDTNVQLTCDTGLPQGVFMDTLSIHNHNFTKSAAVSIQGADNGAFSPVGISIPLTVELNNMYYIAPDLPLSGYEYWRLNVDDPTNPDGYIQIGIILFGSSSIFSVHENMENPIVKGRRHFKDVIPTEGFTNISNDRALRKWVRLTFADLERDQNNLSILDEIFEYARTSLKCLWIPTPEAPSRFAIFGKIAELPDEPTVDNGDEGGQTSLEFEVDESL